MSQDFRFPNRDDTAPSHVGLRLSARIGMIYLALSALIGCGSAHHSSSTSTLQTANTLPSIVTAPTTIDLYPSTDSNRLYIFVRDVGQDSVSLPLIFDTGSAGMTLYAPDIFPPSMFNADGTLIFPQGKSSFTYNGITVTNQRVDREYGGTEGTTETGYLAYAQITFGDNSSQLTTSKMPIFLYSSSTAATTGKTIQNSSGFSPAQGIFGVDPLADPFTATSLAPGTPACSVGTDTPCYVVSVLKYITYSNSLDAGFRVQPANLQNCSPSVSTPGNCLPEPMLSVGIDSNSIQGFSITDLSCPPDNSELPPYYGPSSILNYPVCEKSIPNGTVTMSGAFTGYASGRILFDSGTPEMIFYPSTGSNLPSSLCSQTNVVTPPTTVLVSLSSGFTYEYTSDCSPISDRYTLVDANVNNEQNHVGVAYFDTNFFFIDYTKSSEGWK